MTIRSTLTERLRNLELVTPVGKHIFDASWDDIVMTDKKGSYIIKWRISRLGNDEADTYSSTTKFLEFDIHYQVNKFGSPTVVPI